MRSLLLPAPFARLGVALTLFGATAVTVEGQALGSTEASPECTVAAGQPCARPAEAGVDLVARHVRSLSDSLSQAPAGWAFLGVEARLVWNSEIPFSLNEGVLWAGRGANARVGSGVRFRNDRLLLVLAPEVVVSENRAFDEWLPEAWDTAQRAPFGAPWQKGRNAVDLPYRLGEGPVRGLEPGQSTIAVLAGGTMVGLSTETQWWGPSRRNALVMSGNAPGVPHAFVATSTPWRTRLGQVEARWLVGTLSSSPLAVDSLRGRRSLSAAVIALHPGAAPGLSLGLARAVYAPLADWSDLPGRAADWLVRRGAGTDTLARGEPEQVLSLFARWRVPAQGAEVYGEWGRYEMPESFRDLLLAPGHTQGYTLGLSWTRDVREGMHARLQGELTYLERSSTYRVRPTGSWYASAGVPHGYTHRGRTVGAAIGPGASSQWLAAGLEGDRNGAGVFAGRIRWNNDAYYDVPVSRTARYRGHDVTVFAGLNASTIVGPVWMRAEYTAGQRYNYFFQNASYNWESRDLAVNVLNHTFSLDLRPARR